MNKTYKWIVSALFALALVTSTLAATNTVAVAKVSAIQTTSLFNAGEFGLSIASAYDVGTAESVNGDTLFQDPYTLNFNAGVFWFPFRNLGVEANVPFYQSKGVSVSEVQAGLVLRLPLAKQTPVFRNLAPYVGVSAVYNWETPQNWAYIGKAGLEARLNKNWGIFAEGQYRNYELQNWEQGSVGINGGLRLVF